ncbi:MAG: NADH-quinone oxidoreductase subunit F, partial [Candidatus Firestonebacteria bacterium]|nr:NADH-quinone oxidoreductase subunit F [Candidatus Firestonebacteria bacterium]
MKTETLLSPATAPALEITAAEFLAQEKTLTRRVVVCAGTGCVANGSLKVHAAFARLAAEQGLNVVVELRAEAPDSVYFSKSGCQGFCQMGPLVTILPEGWLYTKVKEADVAECVERTLVKGEKIERLLYVDRASQKTCDGMEEIPFYQKQHRFVLKECGRINPEDLREYIARGGYQAARRVCTQMTPAAVCQEMLASGLRGRGGAGFPTGKKWDLTRVQPKKKKYLICNGDEGDPGAFMDRSVMEGNPHSVLEGMVIASRAFGADEGFIYVRAEYPLAVQRMRRAVADAEALGLLGEKIFGSEHSLRLTVMEGAGAFVCGEETALMASIEGKRGMPSPKPPFPAVSGLYGKPHVHDQRNRGQGFHIINNRGLA